MQKKVLSFELNQIVQVPLKSLAKLKIHLTPIWPKLKIWSVPMVNKILSESSRVSCWVVVCFGGASRWSMAEWSAEKFGQTEHSVGSNGELKTIEKS